MFKINDLIVYGNEGVCNVADIRNLDFAGIDSNKLYYILNPLYSEGKVIYAPVDTNVFMRPIISSDTAQKLIDRLPNMEVEIYDNGSLRELNDYYKSLINTHKCEDLFHLIRTVYIKEDTAIKNKKKIGQTDKNYMRVAEEMLYGEFAVALGIPKDEVKDYITQRVETIQ